LANQYLKYTSKDYDSIKTDLIDSISTLTSTWTSRDEGDPGIVLIKLMSALGDMLSFNMDKQALEYYAPTVTQRKNASKLFSLIGYKMHWYRTAETTVTLTNNIPMPDYIYTYKQVGEIYDKYKPDVSGIKPFFVDYASKYSDENYIYLPPKDEPLPQGQDDYITLPVPPDIENPDTTVLNLFANNCKGEYTYWQDDDTNAIMINTYIENPDRTIGLYSSDVASLSYSLIPTTQNMDPQFKLKPYVPQKAKAIQGYLCETSFTTNQLKDNRYYLPDFSIDENYIWICYNTNNINGITTTVFLEKTDNLLTVNKFTVDTSDEHSADQNGTVVYFEFGVDDFDCPYIELASYWKSIISEEITFRLYYIRTDGKYGNISNNYLNKISSSGNVVVTNVMNTDYVIGDNGEYLSAPGQNPQNANDAYIDSINYIMTYNTLVTIYDFSRFLKRQNGISNGYACDIQYAIDTNEEILKVCNAYTKEQLLNILGENANSDATQAELVKQLYNIRKIVYDYNEADIYVSEAEDDPAQTEFESYMLNMYPIWRNFNINDSDESTTTFAVYINKLKPHENESDDRFAPYYLYRIKTQDIDGSENPEEYCIETMLNNAIRDTKIVNIKPQYTACRVFPWRCCGTLHLTQSVSENDANNIIKAVIDNLASTYSPYNIKFGKKITYMEVIDTILKSDDRIRYFDAGIGNKKLIDFAYPDNLNEEQKYYNVEAYFNPESIMRYVQTFDENNTEISDYYKMIIVDPTYIQTQNN
jgi:hypothetical protein